MVNDNHFDITKARRETPGCEQIIHFNNAGASLMPQPVLDTMVDYLQLEARIGGYEAALHESEKIEAVYSSLASLLSSDVDEIAVVENATRAWDMAFYSIPFKRGERILTARASYASNYIAFLQLARKFDLQIDVIPNDEFGQVSVFELEKMMDRNVRLVAITHIPTNGGLVNPAEEIGRVVKQSNAYYLLDACQAAGQIELDVNRIGCDMLSGTSRKFLRGPRGMGFLFVRKEILEDLEPPFLDLHAARWLPGNEYAIRKDARRFENWETNYAAKVGMGAAVDYAMSWGIKKIQERVVYLADELRELLQEIEGVRIHDLGKNRCGIVTFSVHDKDAHQLAASLQKEKINVSVSLEASTRLDMEARNLKELIRASVHYFNTKDEIKRFCEVLQTVKNTI